MPQSIDPNAPDYYNPSFTGSPTAARPNPRSLLTAAPADPRKWGGHGAMIDPTTGLPVPGTSAADDDIARYNKMANAAQPGAPVIDQSRSNEARGLEGGALGMLRNRAEGGMTPAQQLAQQQTQGAVAGIQSGAASIKGGAAARAAAARGAIATGARVGAQGAQDQQALQAREMADAAGQYFGAATTQRGQDLGVASDQAKLEAQARAAADQHRIHYDTTAFNTGNVQNQGQLGNYGQDAAANAMMIKQGQAADATSRDQNNRIVGTITGGISGAAAAGANTSQPAAPQQPAPYDPNNPNNPNYSGSDERMKRDVRPITDAQAARLIHSGDIMLGQHKAPLGTGPAVGRREPAPAAYDGKYLEPVAYDSRRAPPDMISGAGKRSAPPKLLDAIEARIASDKAAEPRYGYLDAEDGKSRLRLGGAPGYAAERAGHPGAMFGGPAPVASYAPLVDHDAGQAPGTEDFYAGAHHLYNKADREIAMSDPKAKQEAFFAGQRHAVQGLGFDDMPAYAKADLPASEIAPTHQPASFPANMSERRQPAGDSPVRQEFMTHAEYDRAPRRVPAPPGPGALERGMAGLVKYGGAVGPESGSGFGATNAVQRGQEGIQALAGYDPIDINDVAFGHAPVRGRPEPDEQPMAPPPSKAEPPSYFGGLAARARAALSDPRAKTGVHDSPMAAANRSMAPSSYAYKPEFTPPEQVPGEVNVGPMANKMEANPVAKTAIVKDPQTGLLAIDKTKGLKLVMGGLSSLQREVDRMKGARQ